MNETEKRSGTALLQRGEKAEEAGERERKRQSGRHQQQRQRVSERKRDSDKVREVVRVRRAATMRLQFLGTMLSLYCLGVPRGYIPTATI